MVPRQDVDGTARGRRLALQPLQQVQQAQLGLAPVEDVPHLDERGVAARPAGGGVDQARGAQGADGLVVVAMQVAQGDEAAGGRVEGAGRGLGVDGEGGMDGEKGG